MTASNRPRPISPFYRPGFPGYALRCLREATGLTRLEAGELCGLSAVQIKNIELYDEGWAVGWAAMESRYHLFLDGELLAQKLGIGRNGR